MANEVKNMDDEQGLAPALKYVGNLAAMAAGSKNEVTVVPLAGDPLGRYLLVECGGYKIGEPAPAPRTTELGSVSEVAGFVEYASDLHPDNRPAVYYDEYHITVVVNDSAASRKLDVATCTLEQTQQFQILAGMAGKALKQRDFIKLFTRDLVDCLPEDEALALVRAVRAIDFESSIKGSDVVGRGKESMGREIKHEIQSQSGPIPEGVVLTMNVMTDRALLTTSQIKCLIEIDPRQQCFMLEPLAGQIDDAVATATEAVGRFVRASVKESAPVFFGCP